MSTLLERHRQQHFRSSLTATAERSVMSAENQVHKHFLRFAETISNPADFFDPRNRDLWLGTFARWLEEQVGKWGCSND